MWKLLWIGLGGAIGTLARYGLNGLISEQHYRQLSWATVFPLGTVVVNVTGCFAIGVLAAMSDPALGRSWLKPELRDFLMIGFCGGYTTFSSYGVQTLNLAHDSEWLWAGLNIIGSNVLGLVAVYAGWVCGRLLQARLHGGTL